VLSGSCGLATRLRPLPIVGGAIETPRFSEVVSTADAVRPLTSRFLVSESAADRSALGGEDHAASAKAGLDADSERLAAKGKALTPAERRWCCQIVRPETILAWFRKLASQKYDDSKAREVGRPRKPSDVRELVLNMARDNVTGLQLRGGYARNHLSAGSKGLTRARLSPVTPRPERVSRRGLARGRAAPRGGLACCT
jgi:hypothetical protein